MKNQILCIWFNISMITCIKCSIVQNYYLITILCIVHYCFYITRAHRRNKQPWWKKLNDKHCSCNGILFCSAYNCTLVLFNVFHYPMFYQTCILVHAHSFPFGLTDVTHGQHRHWYTIGESIRILPQSVRIHRPFLLSILKISIKIN